MEPEQRRTGQFVTTFMSAYGISCGGAIRCITAAPTASPKTRCSANWESCRFVEPSWSPVRESAVKPVGKPDALIGHVRFDERGWETGRRFGVSTRAHPRLYTSAPLSPQLRRAKTLQRGQHERHRKETTWPPAGSVSKDNDFGTPNMFTRERQHPGPPGPAVTHLVM